MSATASLKALPTTPPRPHHPDHTTPTTRGEEALACPSDSPRHYVPPPHTATHNTHTPRRTHQVPNITLYIHTQH